MAQVSNLSVLYNELSRFGQSGDYDRALKTVNKIIQEAPDDHKAYHCKVICLCHLDEFEAAVKTIDKYANDLLFEKAYCLYRLNRVKEAWSILQTISNPSSRVQELSAQVLYRLEQYEECFDAFKDLIKNSEDDYEEERETNLTAILAGLYADGKEVRNPPQLREHTYELCYNSACILLGQGRYQEAVEKLRTAEELCKKTLEDDDVAEDEIEAEVGVIRAQMGYALQMLKRTDQAMKLYNQVLKQRPTDIALSAVASNNIVTINKDQNVFDSKKKMKTATVDGLESKLNSIQRQAIALNHCLLLLHTNQADQCKHQLPALRKKFPDIAADAALVEAAVLCREKQVSKAVNLLKDFEASHPDQSLAINFTLVQLLLSQGSVNQACNILNSLDDISYTPGVVSALVALYQSLEDHESASNTLKNAINWYKKNKPTSAELGVLVRESARIHLACGQAEEAAKLLVELRKSNPNDPKTLAQLISAYSQFDPKKAKEVSKELPSVGNMFHTVDVDILESTNWAMGARYVKKTVKTEPSPATQPDSGNSLVQKKKKKKKKGKLPKNYDPNVDPDPERWLPKRERSTYKKRKDKRGTGIGKGTQGAISGETETTKVVTSPRPGAPSTTPTTATTTTTPGPGAAQASPNPQGPRQQRPQATQKKKKKKGGRW